MQTLLSEPLWWHWMALGILLIAAEIFVPSFVVIWFGIAAVAVSLMELFFHISLSAQLFWWAVLSAAMLYIWLKKYKHRFRPEIKTGQADEAKGAVGIVTEAVPAHGRGRARFDIPVLGSSEWVVTSEEAIPEGAKVVSIKALGNMLEVQKV